MLFFCLTVRADGDLQATNLWTFAFQSVLHDDYPISTPAVGADGTIYAGSFDGKLYAVSPNGNELWHFQAGREIKSSPAIADDGIIYFGARDHELYAVTPAGKLKWKFTAGAWIDSSAAVGVDGTIYFGSWDKNFYALNPDGSLKWQFATGGIVDSSPAIGADGTIYFGSHDKKLYALEPDGKPRWTFLTGAEITSSPAIGDDGDIYFSSTDGNLYRLKSDGKEAWHYRIGGGSDSSPVLAENGNIVISAAYSTFMVSSAGAKVWSIGSPSWLDETPAAAQGTVCFSAPWHRLWALNPAGGLLWSGQLDENLGSSPVISTRGEIYFCAGLHLIALQPPTALQPAKSSWPMFRANARHNGRVGVN